MNFNDWFKSNWRKASAIMGLLGLTPIASYVIKYMQEAGDWKNLIPFSLNALLIAFLLTVFLKITPHTHVRHSEASDKVKKFNYTWIVFLFVFFIQYFYFTIIEAGQVFGFIKGNNPIMLPPTKKIIEYVLAETTTLALFFCYIRIAGYRLSHVFFPAFLVWIFGIVIYTIAFAILDSKYNNMLNLAIEIISSGINCVILAIFISRLDSKVIATPLVVISALYLYAALQAITGPIDWAVDYYRSKEAIEQFKYPLHLLEQANGVLTIVGAILKGLLFSVVYWLLDTGMLLFYFDWIINKSGSLESDRRTFLSSL